LSESPISNLTLYLLQAIGESDRWRGVYDMAYGYVVAASSPEEARQAIVDAPSGDSPGDEGDEAWLDPKHSTCEAIGTTTKYEKPTVVLRDFAAG
jgi:hypothetical protein